MRRRDDYGDGDARDTGFEAFMSDSAHRLHRVAYLLTNDTGQAEELSAPNAVSTDATGTVLETTRFQQDGGG